MPAERRATGVGLFLSALLAAPRVKASARPGVSISTLNTHDPEVMIGGEGVRVTKLLDRPQAGLTRARSKPGRGRSGAVD